MFLRLSDAWEVKDICSKKLFLILGTNMEKFLLRCSRLDKETSLTIWHIKKYQKPLIYTFVIGKPDIYLL